MDIPVPIPPTWERLNCEGDWPEEGQIVAVDPAAPLTGFVRVPVQGTFVGTGSGPFAVRLTVFPVPQFSERN